MNPLSMILADLRSLRWTAVVVVVLVAAAVASGVLLDVQERAFRHASTRAATDFPLVVGAPGSQSQLVLSTVYLRLDALPLMDGATIRRLEGDRRVASVAPIAFGDVVKGHPVIGTTADFATRRGSVAVVEGRMFAAEGEAVVGSAVGMAVGDEFAPSHGHGHVTAAPSAADLAEEARHVHHGVTHRVVGRLAPTGGPWDEAVVVPIETVWETHGLGDGHAAEGQIGPPFDAEKIPGVPALVVRPQSFADAYGLRAELRAAGLLALFPAEVLVDIHAALGNAREALEVANAIDAALILLAVAALLVTVTTLRRHRHAVLRAIGAPWHFVFVEVWAVGAILVGLGCAIGCGLGFGAASVFARLLERMTGLTIVLEAGGAEFAHVAIVFAVGAAIAGLPAVIAARRVDLLSE